MTLVTPLTGFEQSEAVKASSLKICADCKEEKPYSEFHRDSSKKDGLRLYCKDCMCIRHRKWYVGKGVAGRHREGCRQYYLKNAEVQHERSRHWAEVNPEVNRTSHKRSNDKRRAKLASVDFDSSINLVDLRIRDRNTCGICSESVHEELCSVDHIIPISRGGPHTWDNVQLAHIKCNIHKAAKLPEELGCL